MGRVLTQRRRLVSPVHLNSNRVDLRHVNIFRSLRWRETSGETADCEPDSSGVGAEQDRDG